ncbi:hypothetical protein A5695_15395 [Mycobacterium sp. E1747]|nr:hypothetical protein A5695_15395 [Mycobacterium sp. E1747]
MAGDGEPTHTSATAEGPADVSETPESDSPSTDLPRDSTVWPRLIAGVLLPVLIVLLGGGSGYLAWETLSERLTQQARIESVHAATDGISALLAYDPDTAEKSLSAACELLTGKFKTSYAVFTHQHVIPDARERHITSVVTVPAAASVQATIEHAVVMVFVNQTFLRDPDPPKSTASDVRVTLEKVGRRWLISDFTPVR